MAAAKSQKDTSFKGGVFSKVNMRRDERDVDFYKRWN
jgi:hypothetical protein